MSYMHQFWPLSIEANQKKILLFPLFTFENELRRYFSLLRNWHLCLSISLISWILIEADYMFQRIMKQSVKIL